MTNNAPQTVVLSRGVIVLRPSSIHTHTTHLRHRSVDNNCASVCRVKCVRPEHWNHSRTRPREGGGSGCQQTYPRLRNVDEPREYSKQRAGLWQCPYVVVVHANLPVLSRVSVFWDIPSRLNIHCKPEAWFARLRPFHYVALGPHQERLVLLLCPRIDRCTKCRNHDVEVERKPVVSKNTEPRTSCVATRESYYSPTKTSQYAFLAPFLGYLRSTC